MIITPTTLQCKGKYLILARLVHYKYYVIEFSADTKACELVDYFNMPDVMFTKFGRITDKYKFK